jgi:hypothetical protein
VISGYTSTVGLYQRVFSLEKITATVWLHVRMADHAQHGHEKKNDKTIHYHHTRLKRIYNKKIVELSRINLSLF